MDRSGKHTKRHKNHKRRNRQQTPAGLRLFYFFFGVLLLVMPLVYYISAIDKSQMSRLTLINLLLLFTGAIIFGNKRLRHIDFSVFRQRIFLMLGGFLLITLISAFFALNPGEVSFDIVRTLMLIGGLAFSALLMLRTPDWQGKISRLAIVAALPALIIGAVQYVQRVIQADTILLSDGRILEYAVSGLMGHKNMYSVFLILLLPFTVYGIYRFKKGWGVASVLVTISILLMVVLLKTRSAWLGILLGGIVALVLLLVFAKSFRFSLFWRKGIAAVMIAGAFVFTVLMFAGRTADPFSLPGRLYSIFDSQSQHNIHRLNVWKGSLQMAADHPVIGVGPGNWKIKAPLYFNHQFTELSALRWARPHNDFLWILAEKGILGMLFYLGIFGFAFFYLVRVLMRRPAKNNIDDHVMAVCIFGGLTAYLVDSAFSFPYERIDIQALLFIMLAASVVLYHCQAPRASLMPNRRLMAILSLLLFGFGSFYGFRTAVMEKHVAGAMASNTAGNWENMLYHAQKAQNPYRTMDPSLYPVAFYQGLAYAGKQNHQAALHAFKKAQKHSPHNVHVLDQLAIIYHKLGRYNEAIDCAKQILDIIPRLSNASNNLAVYYYEIGEYEKAYHILTDIENWQDDPNIVYNVEIMKQRMEASQQSEPAPLNPVE